MSSEGGLDKKRQIDVFFVQKYKNYFRLFYETISNYSPTLALIKILNPICTNFNDRSVNFTDT